MTHIEAALVKEQGVKFAVVVVKRHVIQNQITAKEAITGFSRYFPGNPIVLMAQDSRGLPTYYGRKDIVNFLSGLHMGQLPWKRYSFND